MPKAASNNKANSVLTEIVGYHGRIYIGKSYHDKYLVS